MVNVLIRGECDWPGCANPHKSGGLCSNHYAQARRWAQGLKGRYSADPVARFWSKVGPPSATLDECWLWCGKRYPLGYGKFTIGRKILMAHRYAYEQMIAPIPDGLSLDHLCRNPPCVNPFHLDPVPISLNIKRARDAQRAAKRVVSR